MPEEWLNFRDKDRAHSEGSRGARQRRGDHIANDQLRPPHSSPAVGERWRARAGEPPSSHAGWRVFTSRTARQTAELHLKPEPKAICQTRSPRRTPRFVSMFAST